MHRKGADLEIKGETTMTIAFFNPGSKWFPIAEQVEAVPLQAISSGVPVIQ